MDAHLASLHGVALSLTPKEYGVLRLLVERAGRPVSARDIYEEVWREPFASSSSNSVMVHIRHLREKLARSIPRRTSSRPPGAWAIASSRTRLSDGAGARMRRLESAQAKDLWRRLVMRLIALLVAYTAAFGVAAVCLEKFVIPDVADRVADATSEWMYLDWDSYVEFMQNAHASGQYWDSWSVDDETYAVRNLDTYNAIKSMKVLFAVLAYTAGFVIIVVLVLRRSLEYFDELSSAVGGLMANGSAPVGLGDDLSIVRAELTAVRERSLADERAAQAAEVRKNELVAYLAHDVKTPLTSVIGYLELCATTPICPRPRGSATPAWPSTKPSGSTPWWTSSSRSRVTT